MKPTPVHTGTVCSECGLAWDRHGADPTLETCVALLKGELRATPLPCRTLQPWWGPLYGTLAPPKPLVYVQAAN